MNPTLPAKYKDVLTQMDAHRLYGLHIEGIEVTQSVQHYRSEEHLTTAAGRGPDNTVQLIAGKPAWVRVYIRSGASAEQVWNVTGELEILRGSFGGPFSHVIKLAPMNAPFLAVRNISYAAERGNRARTLNFAVPPSVVRKTGDLNSPIEEINIMCGYLRFRVTIQAPGWPSHSIEVDLNVTLQQTLRVRGFLLNYFGPPTSKVITTSPLFPPIVPPPIFFPAPTAAGLRSTAALALQVLPVQAKGTFSFAGISTWDRPLDDTATNGGCSANWTALLKFLQEWRVEDENRSDWLYYGLLPLNTPVGSNTGCGDKGLGAGIDQSGAVMLHELGHACGLIHAPCGNVGDSDPTYPAYEPYDLAWNTTLITTGMYRRGSIGEYGLDTSTGKVMSPATYRDIMSYCGPYNWISLHNYRQLTDHPSLAPQNVCRPPSPFDDFDFDPWWWLPWHRVPDPPPPELAERLPVPERLISLIGTVRSPMEVEVTSVMRVDAFREVRGGRSTDYTAELIGADGKPVARAPLFALLPQGCGCGCQGCDHERSKYPFDFQAFISNLETGAALAIRDFEGKEVWTRNPSQEHPAVAAFRARAEGVFLALSWDIRVAGSSQPHCWVQWSADGGRRWQGLATRLSGNEARLEVPFLPPGPILLRFCVSDGFETAVSATETVEIPEREPQAGVLGPRPGQKFMAGQTIRVWGYGTGTRGEELAGRSARWYLDDSEAALGFDVFLEAPEPGEHRLTLVVEDAGFRAHSSVVFITLAQPESAGA